MMLPKNQQADLVSQGGAGVASIETLKRPLWSVVCRHLDGIAVGSTLVALAERGVLDLLAGESNLSMRRLLQHAGGNVGYLHVALRLLACQGWLVRSGIPGTDDTTFTLTSEGRLVATLAPFYQQATSFLSRARHVLQPPLGQRFAEISSDLVGFCERLKRAWDLPERDIPRLAWWQVRHHLDGHVVAPMMALLGLYNLPELVRESKGMLDLERLEGGSNVWTQIFEVLACLGWVEIEGQRIVCTPKGTVAIAYARQYWYPMSYLETLIEVPTLLFGDPSLLHAKADRGTELHVNRALDIQFSGAVFENTCKRPFFDVVLPLFERLPLASQPIAVVDTGCGNGVLLKSLYEGVRDRTSRGRHLSEYPLVMVGVEPSAVARETTSAALALTDVPHYVIEGDIANPDKLARKLCELGIDPYRSLHVSKAVIHNRPYYPPKIQPDPYKELARSLGAFSTPDGSAIPNAHLEQNLIEHFQKWQDLSRSYGLFVIEAHTIPPSTTASLLGNTITTILDATHGYSNQYPVEIEVFFAAAGAAGFAVRDRKIIGAKTVGHPVLTLSHFVLKDNC